MDQPPAQVVGAPEGVRGSGGVAVPSNHHPFHDDADPGEGQRRDDAVGDGGGNDELDEGDCGGGGGARGASGTIEVNLDILKSVRDGQTSHT